MVARRAPDRVEARRERLERHAATEDVEVVLAAAGRYLEQRQRSVAEVRRHLLEARYPENLVETAIERMLLAGMLDDRAFASAWVESRDRARPRGEQALRRELTLRGLDRELIAEVLVERAEGRAELSSDGGAAAGAEGPVTPDYRAALRLLERRRAALGRVADPRLRRQRAYALLARNGFDPDVCRQASLALERSSADRSDTADEGVADGHPDRRDGVD